MLHQGIRRVSEHEARAMGLLKSRDANTPSISELIKQGKVPEHLIGPKAKYEFQQD